MNLQNHFSNHSKNTQNQKISDQKMLAKIISQQKITLQDILIFARSPLKQNCQLIKRLFQNQAHLVQQMIDWMFNPIKMLQKQYSKQMNLIPMVCCQFIQQNDQFYERMFKSAIPSNPTLPIQKWCQFILSMDKEQTLFHTSLGYFGRCMFPFIDYLEDKKEGSKTNKEYILQIFKKTQIYILIDQSHYKIVFEFITKLINRCFQEQNKEEQQNGEILLQNLINKVTLHCDRICFMENFLRETYSNMQKWKSIKIVKIVKSLLSATITQQLTDKVKQSPLCKTNSFNWIDDQEDQIQNCLKVLKLIVLIYGYVVEEQGYISTQQIQKFKFNITQIIKSLPYMVKLVLREQTYLQFSSGQNIKSITLVKYQYFQLLLECLLIIQLRPQDQFYLDMDKIQIFNLLQRYNEQNRWNNNAQHCLEKIINCLVRNNANFFMKSKLKIYNIADTLLANIIEQFNNNKYVFLTTFCSINQGNLYSLYKIGYTISKLLKQEEMKEILPKFKSWSYFFKTQIKEYKQKIQTDKIKPIDFQQEKYDCRKNSEDEESILKIDQIQQIGEIIMKIDTVQNWQREQQKKKKKRQMRRISKSEAIPPKRQMNIPKNQKSDFIPQDENEAGKFISQEINQEKSEDCESIDDDEKVIENLQTVYKAHMVKSKGSFKDEHQISSFNKKYIYYQPNKNINNLNNNQYIINNAIDDFAEMNNDPSDFKAIETSYGSDSLSSEPESQNLEEQKSNNFKIILNNNNQNTSYQNQISQIMKILHQIKY